MKAVGKAPTLSRRFSWYNEKQDKINSLYEAERISSMKEIKIMKSKIKEALAQIETIEELGPKERGCLRLLTEEMFSMCHELLGTYALDFEIKQDGKRYTLSGTTKTRVDEMAREQLLSTSSCGKNAANKGAMGILGAVLELFSMEEAKGLGGAEWAAYGMYHEGGIRAWTLSRYMEEIGALECENKWDGLEKSIIANFSDDVSIAVRKDKLQMIITKTF